MLCTLHIMPKGNATGIFVQSSYKKKVNFKLESNIRSKTKDKIRCRKCNTICCPNHKTCKRCIFDSHKSNIDVNHACCICGCHILSHF